MHLTYSSLALNHTEMLNWFTVKRAISTDTLVFTLIYTNLKRYLCLCCIFAAYFTESSELTADVGLFLRIIFIFGSTII